MVAKSPADGCTLLVDTNAHAYSAALLANLPYDPLADFVPVAALTTQSYVLVAGETTAVATVDERIAAAKANRGRLRFGSTAWARARTWGSRNSTSQPGTTLPTSPARGSDAIADTIVNTIAGRTDYALSPIPTTLPHIPRGRLRPLGVSSAQRSSALPDVPTVAEAGVAGFDFPIWYGIWAPAATPAGVVQKLAQDIAHALSDPAVRASLVKHGGEPMSMAMPRLHTLRAPASARALPGSSKPPRSSRSSSPPQTWPNGRLRGPSTPACLATTSRVLPTSARSTARSGFRPAPTPRTSYSPNPILQCLGFTSAQGLMSSPHSEPWLRRGRRPTGDRSCRRRARGTRLGCQAKAIARRGKPVDSPRRCQLFERFHARGVSI